MSAIDDYLKNLNKKKEDEDFIDSYISRAKESGRKTPVRQYTNQSTSEVDSYLNSVKQNRAYRDSLPEKDRDAYTRVQMSNGVYSSPYLKSGSEGKEKLKYNNPDWNALSEEERRHWLDIAEGRLEEEYNQSEWDKLNEEQKRYWIDKAEGKTKSKYQSEAYRNMSPEDQQMYIMYAKQHMNDSNNAGESDNWKLKYAAQILNDNSDISSVYDLGTSADYKTTETYDKANEQRWMWNSLPQDVRTNLVNGKKTNETTEYLEQNYSPEEVAMFRKYADAIKHGDIMEENRAEEEALIMGSPLYATVGAPAKQILGSVLLDPIASYFTMKNIKENQGAYGVVDPYATAVQRQAAAGQYIGQSINEGLSERKLAQFAYNTSVSTTESALRLAIARGIGGGISSIFHSISAEAATGIAMNALMAPAVVNQTATELIEKGVPASQALDAAVMHGLFECLFETISFDKLDFFDANPIVADAKTFAKNLIKAGFVEGSEEVATDIANELYDYLTMYDYSDFKAFKDTWDASRGVESTDKEAWGEYKKEFALKLAQSFAGGAVSGLSMGALTNADGMRRANYYRSLGENIDDATANRMRPVVDSVAAVNPNVRGLMENASVDETTARGAMSAVIEQMEKPYIKSIERAKNDNKLNTVMENMNTNLNGLISESAFNAYNAKKIEFGKEGADYQTFLTNRDKGNQTTFSDLAYGNGDNAISKEYRQAQSELENILHNPNADMTSAERVLSAERAVEAMQKSQEKAEDVIALYARQGKTLDDPELRKYVGIVGTENAARAYSMAKLANEAEQNPVQLKKGHVFQATAEEVIKRGLLAPEVARHIKPAAYSKVENTPQFQVLSALANMTGTNVGLFESDRSDEIQNGAWIAGKNTILVDANAGVSGMRSAIGEVISHELTHWIRTNNEAGYDRLYMFLRKDMGEKAFDSLVNDKINHSKELAKKYNRPDLELDTNTAAEEVVAEACQRMLASSETFMRYAAADMEGAKSLLSRLKDFIKKLREYFRGSLHNQATRMVEDFEGLAREWEKALNEAIANANTEAVKQDAMEHGFDFESADDAVYRNSWRYNLTDEQIDKYSKLMSDQLGCTVKEAENYFKAADSLSSFVLDPLYNKYLDYDPDGRYTAIKKNADYPQGTVDFTNNCRKRTIFTNVFDRLQKAMPNRIFNAVTLADLRETLKKFGYKVACALCFVEDRRQRMGEIGDLYVKALTNSHKNFNNVLMYTNSKKQSYPLLMTQTLKDRYGDRVPFQPGEQIVITDDYVPTQYDIVTYDGFAKLTEEHPTVALGFEAYNNRRGMSSARLIEGRGEYKREILSYTPDQVKRINDLGGLRIFSFSDFEVVHLLDLCQIITDCATVGLKIQTYTKVPAFAKLIRNTNIKCNRSLIPKGKGWDVDAKGNKYLVYDTTEGIDINDPDFFDSTDSENIGNILVGINKEQIRLAMVDDFVDYIIPFHTNQAKKVLIKKGISLWDNYKKFQTDKTASGSPTMVNIYTEVLDKYNPQNKYQFVDAFLRECQSRNITPRFEEFIDKENGKYKTVTVDGQTYMYTPGYEKFLVDFKLFDKQGNILPQKAVFPTIDMEFAEKLMKSEAATAKEQDKVDDAVVNELIEKYKDKNAKFSTRDTEYLNAIGRGDQDAAQRYVDEAARKAGYPLKFMHGTNSFGFTTIEYGQSDDGISFFGTDDEEVASTYIRPMEDEDATPHTYVREIGKPHGKIVSASSSIPELIAEYDRVTGKKSGFRPATQKDIDKLLDTRIATVKRSANELLQYSIPDNIDTAVKNIVNANTADEIISAAEAIKDEWNIYYNGEYFQQASFALVDLKDMLDSLKNGMKLKADNLAIYDALNIWRTKSDMVDEILDNGTGIGTRGTYELYGTRKNALVIDCMGSQWNSIPVPVMPRGMREDLGDYAKTRDISKWANDHGYGVVIFKEVKDTGQYGSRFTPPSTVYAFTRDGGESIKSADTVTYTDDGEIIPPSERFNKEEKDIRYSRRKDILKIDGIDWMDDYSSIKDQLRKHQDEISEMNPIAEVIYYENGDDDLIRVIKDIIPRIGGGNIKRMHNGNEITFSLDDDNIKMFIGHATGINQRSAALIAPYVYKYGRLISGHKNHKNRNVTTLTFAAPAIINGVKVNVGAVIQFMGDGRPKSIDIDIDAYGKKKNKKIPPYPGRAQGRSLVTYLPTRGTNNNISQSEADVKRFSTRDSEGNTLTESQAEYFADSKVRDADGNLMVVYHGSPAKDITVFDKNRAGAHTSAFNDKAIWFTNDEKFADDFSYEFLPGNSAFTYRRGEKGKVYGGYLNLTNPFDLTNPTAEMMDYINEKVGEEEAKKLLEIGNHQLIKFYLDLSEIADMGYDGIIARLDTYARGGGIEYGAFESNQFKSIDNESPTESDDIRFSYRDLANSESEILINALKNDAALVDELGAKQSIEAYAREYNRLKEMENQQIEITKQLNKKGTSPSEREVLLKKMVRLDRAILNKTTELTEMRNQRVIRDLLISEWDKRDTLVAAGRAEERYLTRKALEEKYGKELSALKEKTRQQKQEIRDRHTINERKANIIKKTKQLMDMCLHPTEKKKVPTVLINPVVELLDAIDYWTPAEGRRVTKKSESLRERFVNFREAINEYQEQINEGTEQIEYMFDPEFLETVDELAKSVKGINNVNDMNAEEITALDQTLTQLYHLISRGNKMITASHYQTVNEYTDKTRQAMEKRKTLSEKTSAKGSWLSRLNAGMSDTYAFGEYAGEGTREIVDMLSKAFEDKEFHVKEAIEFTQEVLKPYKKELKKWSQDEHEFTLSTTDKDGNPNKVKLTVGQMMELYLLNKREQARGHIYGGGIRVENRKGKFTESVKITESDVAEIMDYLKSVPGAMEVADKLQQYGATTITGWGNQASNLMYGISKFTDENYWQIRSDSSALKDNENTEKALNASMYRLQNMGRTKAVKKGANNAIYIGDVFDTWSKTIDEMTSYASILPATTDAMRWWNSRVELDGENTVRVKKLLESKLGTDMTRVFTDTIKALNGGIMGTDSLESLVKKLTGKAKAAAVAGNLRVVLQQPTAYTRAAAVIDKKYLLKALTMKPNAKEAQEHSAIAWHKAQGFYSNGLAPSLRKMVIGDASIGENLTEKSLWLAGKADDITWGALWNASKLKVEAENKALKVGSDAYWNEVNKVFSNIINQTQVVDTPLTKSTWMRGNGLGVYFTAFMAEPTKTYSMVMERLDRVLQNPTSKDAWKAFAGVGAVFAVNAMVNAMAQALADAARDDDKEKDYWEKYIEQYNKDVKDNINPITYIPVVKDIWSLSQGYSNSNLSMQAAQNTVYAVNELKKIANGTSKKTLFGQAETVAKAISGWTGIPVGNVMRTLNSIGNVAGVDIFRRKKYTNSELGRNVVLSMNEGDTSAADKYMAELLENCKGDTNKANNYVITYLADHDNEIDAWAEKYMEDATTINDAIDAMSDKYSAEIVTKAIRKSVNNDADEDDKIKTSTLAESQYTSDDINRMLENGKITEAQDIIDEVNAKYKEMGSKTTAKNAVTVYWKPKYLAASGAERDKILKMLYKLKNNGQQMYSSKDIAKWK